MSIDAPRNLIIAKFINLGGNCRYGPRGTSQGNRALSSQPHVLMGPARGNGRQEKWGHVLGLCGVRLRTPFPRKAFGRRCGMAGARKDQQPKERVAGGEVRLRQALNARM